MVALGPAPPRRLVVRRAPVTPGHYATEACPDCDGEGHVACGACSGSGGHPDLGCMSCRSMGVFTCEGCGGTGYA